MLKSNLILSMLVCALSAQAQAPRPGKVHLNNQHVVEGVVDVNSFINSAVVTVDDSRQLTYHASMIESITTVDECDRQRQYRTFDYRSSGFFDRLEKKLFQVVEQGEITLLRRIFEYDVFDAEDEYEVEEWYYTTGDKIRRIRSFRRQVLPLMADYADEMKAFKKRNSIGNLNRQANMFLMISHYNTLRAADDSGIALGQ